MIEETRSERIIRFAELHSRARYASGKSQEYFAMELGVSKKTVQNWEKGISSPTFFQSLEWFRIAGLNPVPYYLEYIYSDNLSAVKMKNDDQAVDAAFDEIMKSIPTSAKRALLFILCGKHGSSPISLIQLTLAHIHTPLKSRVVNATVIMHNYNMSKSMNELICTDNIMPDEDQLMCAIEKGQESAINKAFGYVSIKE